ncbi:uncharacterized protein LOC135202646 [Macrobrachium nipponense]|uniref:uncharacterized protein LOC135202646 n=1 Tax=Macrobrachium nipponense TaxID=159736 RepID=UPI0030C7ECCD
MALLGADFLTAHNLLVDIAVKQLIPRTALTSSQKSSRHITTKPSTSRQEQLLCPITPDNPIPEMRELLQKYEDSQRKPEARLTKPAKYSIQHYIETGGPLIHSRFRRLAPEKLTYTKKVFIEMEEAGICQKAPSPWASPLHIVLKSEGTWCPCRDYRQLNVKTKPVR